MFSVSPSVFWVTGGEVVGRATGVSDGVVLGGREVAGIYGNNDLHKTFKLRFANMKDVH